MMSMKKTLRIAGSALMVLLVLAGCRNPFQVGLGDEVNLGVPDIVLNSHAAGQYLNGTVELSGEYTDGFAITGAIRNVTLSFDGGNTTVEATLSQSGDPDVPSSWTYTVDTTDYPDGETEVIITANYQNAGSDPVQKRVLYFFDNHPPLVVLTVPTNIQSEDPLTFAGDYNGGVVVKGEAGDQFGIASVEFQVQSSGGTLLQDWTGADGTNSWSFSFDSLPYISSSGNLRVVVRATDRAGNTSEGVMHTDVVVANNGGAAISVEALVAVANGTNTTAAIDAGTISAITRDYVLVSIDQNADRPQFIISNPDESSPIGENVLSSAPRFTGSVEDDNEGIDVDSLTYEIYLVGDTVGVDTPQTSGTLNPASDVDGVDGDLFVRWSIQESGLTDGDYFLVVRAADEQGTSGTSNQAEFRVDSGAPTVAVSTPSQGAYLNGAFTITGTASDLQGVTGVEVSVDGGSTWLPADNLTGSIPDFNWDILIDPTDTVTYPPSGIPDGPLNVKIRATDGISVANFNLTLILDSEVPSATFINPAASSSVNGSVIIRGTATDNNQVTKVELKVGASDPYVDLSPQLYNWEYTIDSTSYANATHATETPPASNVWRLDVSVRVTDVANNQHVQSFFFYIDNDLDKPTTTIIAPSDGQVVAGPIIVTGVSVDDDGVGAVYMQIDVDGDGLYDTVSADLNGTIFDETAPILLDGTNAWTYELNGDGSLYYADGFAADDGWVTLKVWTEDINTTVGNPVEVSVQFDDTIPRVDNLNLASGDYVRGTFNLTADAMDDDAGAVRDVSISYDGGQSYTLIVDDGTIQPAWTTAVTYVTDYQFALDIPIDTESTLPGLAGPISSGILYLRLRVTDYTPTGETITFINVNVDNQYPSGAWDYAVDPLEIDGTALVQGTATDSGTVSGIGWIEVYFVRNIGGFDKVYDLSASDTYTDVVMNDFGDGSGSVAYTPDNGASNTPPYYRIVIDDTNEFGNDAGGNGDGDTFNESITLAGSTYTWYADFDSTVIPDGEVDIHYVVFDSSGNGTHYLLDADNVTGGYQASFIKNNRPTISTLTVGTDLNADDAVTDGVTPPGSLDEQLTYSTGFDIRNRLFVQINASDSGPNAGIATYDVRLDSDDSSVVPLSGTYDTGAIVDVSGWSEGSTITLYAYVVDNDGITARYDFDVTVDNVDAVAPTVSLSALAQSSIKGYGGTLEGHLEAQDESLHDGTDPDVSGIMILDGTAWDDQRIDQITVQIAGFDAGSGTGAAHVVAQWNGTSGVLESQVAEFTIDTQTLTEAAGHNIAWSYEWDSSGVTGVAANNVLITIDAQDFGPNSATDATETVDVVPYISSVERDPAIYSTDRSKYGTYPIQADETDVTIYGFNLNNTGDVVIHTEATGGDLVTAGTSDALSVTAVGAGYTSLTVDLTGVTHSGWLRLTVGPSAIEATNLENDNTLDQNKEDDGSGLVSTLWTDDRYISVWEVGDYFAQSASPEHPSMDIRTSNGTIYGAWSNYAASAAYHAQPNSVSAVRTTIFTTYDPPEYTDIALEQGSADRHTVILENYYGGSGTTAWGFLATYINAGTREPIDDMGNGNDPANPDHSDGYDEQLYQFQNPRIAISNEGTNLHYVAYYDAWAQAVKYSAATNGAATFTSVNHMTDSATVVDGQDDFDNNPSDSGDDVGQYLDIGIDPDDGYPVIVYYDTTNKTLKIAGGQNATPNGTGQWTVSNVLSASSFSGQFVSMKVNSAGDLFISYYKVSTGDLEFIHALDVDGGASYTFDTPVAIDTDGAVGAWTDIFLLNGYPVISYLNSSQIGTFSGLKVARYIGDGTSWTDEADWEHEIVPAATAVFDKRTNVVGMTTGGWDVAVGYASSYFDLVYSLVEE